MTAANAGACEASRLRLGPGGLLATKAQWLLPLGLTQAPPVLWAVRGLLVLMGLSLLAYLLALWRDATAGTVSWVAPVLTTCLVGAWGRLAWLMWMQLSRADHLMLAWCGLVPAPSKMSSPPSQPIVRAGWFLPEHEQAASVQLVFDLGVYVLLRVSVVSERSGARSWWPLLAGAQLEGANGHHLRTLLFSVRTTETGVMKDPRQESTSVMASFGSIQRVWLALFVHPNLPDQKIVTAAVRRKARARAVMGHGDFAATILLEKKACSDPAPVGDRSSDTRQRWRA